MHRQSMEGCNAPIDAIVLPPTKTAACQFDGRSSLSELPALHTEMTQSRRS